jgi:hypothetical protein
MMKPFDSRSNVIKTMASPEYEEEYDEYGGEEGYDEYEDCENDGDEGDEGNGGNDECDEDDDKYEEMDEDDYPWEKAIEHHGIFYGNSVFIALVYQEQTRCNYKEGMIVKPLKWRIGIRKGKRWVVAEEHPLDCDIDEVFSEYGLPSEFTPISGYYRDDGAIIPWK